MASVWHDAGVSSHDVLTLHRARLTDGSLVDLDVIDGRVSASRPAAAAAPEGATDLDGWLLLPALAEPHAHLDKALSAEMVPNPAGDLDGAIHAWVAALVDGTVDADDIADRATAALEKLLVSGVTAVRSHVDVGAATGTAFVEAVGEARRRLGDRMQVQLVGLCHGPIAGDDGAANRAALDAALDAGLDLVGGCSYREPEVDEVLDHLIGRAVERGMPLDLHVDETLAVDVLTLDSIARRVLDGRCDVPVTASHCVSLGMQTPEVQAAVSARVADAGVSIVTLPHTNLFLQGRAHPVATPRGLTGLDALASAGARVCAGADNVQDPFNLVGRSDPLETAALLVMAGHRLPERALEMVSGSVFDTLGLDRPGVAVGDVADYVAIDAASVREAISDAPRARRTIRAGRVVAAVDESVRID